MILWASVPTSYWASPVGAGGSAGSLVKGQLAALVLLEGGHHEVSVAVSVAARVLLLSKARKHS